MTLRQRMRRLDDNPVSGGIACVGTNIGAPVAVVGGLGLLIIGLIEAATGGADVTPLLIFGAVWLVVGLVLLPPRLRRRLSFRR